MASGYEWCGVRLNASEVTDGRPEELAWRVYMSPALSKYNPLPVKFATPPTASIELVPPSSAPDGLLERTSVTRLVAVETS